MKTCPATAGGCRCVKSFGHTETDEVHACDEAECTGQWQGIYGAGSFRIVRAPRPGPSSSVRFTRGQTKLADKIDLLIAQRGPIPEQAIR